MKVYIAEKDADKVARVWFWWKDVTKTSTKVGLWLGAVKWGLGFVDLVHTEGDHIISAETRRYYGPILIKFKESKQ